MGHLFPEKRTTMAKTLRSLKVSGSKLGKTSRESYFTKTHLKKNFQKYLLSEIPQNTLSFQNIYQV